MSRSDAMPRSNEKKRMADVMHMKASCVTSRRDPNRERERDALAETETARQYHWGLESLQRNLHGPSH